MIFLAGDTIEKKVFIGSKSAYYSAERKKDGCPVTVKVAVGATAGDGVRERFGYERDLLNLLKIPGVPSCYGIERYRNSFALILEALPGACLASGNNRNRFHLRDSLTVGSKTAAILASLHERNVVHKDINPEAIFYCPETGGVWLGEFGSAGLPDCPLYASAQRKREAVPPAYMSPEQTGRTNRSVDFRTDFYSLGATLYELMTGGQPFSGEASPAVVNRHLARLPLPPCEVNTWIPETVSAIVMKLLARSPDNRYQSAWGLKHDLDVCIEQLDMKQCYTSRKKASEALRQSDRWQRKENVQLRANMKDRYRFRDIVGKSKAMQEIYEFILKAAATEDNVLISGESGTGKELVAQAIHELSERKDRNLIAVNCGAIPDNLMESEFFGYKKGAFTGAAKNKRGYLDLADGGTLFLDELGELSLNMQVKLLRVLDRRGFFPVGGNDLRHVDIRFIAASNRNLQEMVSKGLMREDFFYRIHILPAQLPPLRERREDLPLLVEHFMSEFGKDAGCPSLTGKMTDAIQRHDWPGNVRELRNVLRRYVTLRHFTLDTPHDATDYTKVTVVTAPAGTERDDHKSCLERYEKDLIESSLIKHNWHREKAAKGIGMARRTFFRKLKKYGLNGSS